MFDAMFHSSGEDARRSFRNFGARIDGSETSRGVDQIWLERLMASLASVHVSDANPLDVHCLT